MRRHANTRTTALPPPHPRFTSALAVVTLLLMIPRVAPAADPELRQNPFLSRSDQAKLARYLWAGMAENRKKLERGSFVATGRRVIDDVTHRSHGEGEVILSGPSTTKRGSCDLTGQSLWPCPHRLSSPRA